MKPIVDTRLENSSFPQLPANPISRDQFLSMFESLLTDNDVIFVSGIGEGSGVTTALSMFVERHCSECFSFFTDGLDLFSQESEVIEESLARQMYLYNKNGRTFDDEHLDLESQIPALKKTGRIFYFVFDGFDKLPKEKAENVKKTFEKLNARQFRFIFSGKKEKAVPRAAEKRNHEQGSGSSEDEVPPVTGTPLPSASLTAPPAGEPRTVRPFRQGGFFFLILLRTLDIFLPPAYTSSNKQTTDRRIGHGEETRKGSGGGIPGRRAGPGLSARDLRSLLRGGRDPGPGLP